MEIFNDNVRQKDLLIEKIEMKIGLKNLTEKEVQFLLNEMNKGSNYALFVYGLYLVIEEKNEQKAIDLIKRKKKQN